ncbi:hypothetical protein CC78DRAFT_546939 [Lojkania enalia]|uniref:Uncharacterized protein n=1 Tax=Lojkania enalia TaxID=147567 RepID=A0A9P4N6W8_9PLEO|nr:hypothetical protein CC78DRAFT_546939 [Didymosphaeria enalia]
MAYGMLNPCGALYPCQVAIAVYATIKNLMHTTLHVNEPSRVILQRDRDSGDGRILRYSLQKIQLNTSRVAPEFVVPNNMGLSAKGQTSILCNVIDLDRCGILDCQHPEGDGTTGTVVPSPNEKNMRRSGSPLEDSSGVRKWQEGGTIRLLVRSRAGRVDGCNAIIICGKRQLVAMEEKVEGVAKYRDSPAELGSEKETGKVSQEVPSFGV